MVEKRLAPQFVKNKHGGKYVNEQKHEEERVKDKFRKTNNRRLIVPEKVCFFAEPDSEYRATRSIAQVLPIFFKIEIV
jgi:hypothetical protein